MWNSLMTLKYIRQGHWQSYHLKAVVWFHICTFINCIYFLNYWTWKWQHRLKWPSNVIEGHRTWYQSTARAWVAIGGLYIVTFAVSLTVSEHADCFNAENYIFAYHACIWPWIWRLCSWNVEMKFGARKLESRSCRTVKKSWSQVEPWGHSPRVWQAYGRTDLRWLRPRYS